MRRAIVGLAVAVLAVACRPGTVELRYRPETGSVARYRIRTEVRTVLRLEGTPPQHKSDSVVLEAVHTVLGRDGRGVRVRVELQTAGAPARSFVVRLDRAAQLGEIVAAGVTLPGDLDRAGFAELFPPAATAPPERPLRPGDRWRIDETVRLPGVSRARLSVTGRLVALGTVDGRPVATVASRTSLSVRRDTDVAGRPVTLTGRPVIQTTTVHDVRDGSVVRARSATEGDFRVAVSPPVPGAPPVTGTLRLRLRWEVVRVG